MPRLSIVCRRVLVLIAFAASFWPASRAAAENWPAWRGPRGDGSSEESAVPTRWDGEKNENIAWKVEVPGTGHASPVIWNDRIFLVSCLEEEHDRVLLCLDRKTGKSFWQKSVLRSPLEKKHALNSYASSTPTTDGELVYVTFLEGTQAGEAKGAQMAVAAYDFAGNQKWLVRPGPFSSVHGYCSCPVLFEDKLIVNGDHDGDAYLVALDKSTGATIWKTPRENRTRSYCTPIIREIDGRTQMLLSGSKCVASYDPHDGSRHWIIDGPTEQFVASLVYTHGLVFVTGGFPDLHVMAINPAGKGNVTDSNIVWRHTGKMASYVPSPIAVGDYILVASDFGLATCLDAATGGVQWSKQLSRHFSASLVEAGGLVYFLDDAGVTHVVKPGKEFNAVAINKLFDPTESGELQDSCSASPAISQGQIFLRTEKALYCIGK